MLERPGEADGELLRRVAEACGVGISPDCARDRGEAACAAGRNAFNLLAAAVFDRPAAAPPLLRAAGARARARDAGVLAWSVLGWTSYSARRYREAEKALARAVRLAPRRADLWQAYAMTLRRRGSPWGDHLMFNLDAHRAAALRARSAAIDERLLERTARGLRRTGRDFSVAWMKHVPRGLLERAVAV